MTKFQNINDLRLERQRLYLKKALLEDEIKQDYEEVKESLKPMNIIKDLFKGDGADHNMNGSALSPATLNLGSTVLDMFISNLIFRKSSFLKKFLSSTFVHAAGPTVIQKVGPTVVSSIKKIIDLFSKKKPGSQIYEQSTVGNGYHD